ncbi:MAG: hypothetical protein RJA22_1809 [Verrucomicrobiota bacterium]
MQHPILVSAAAAALGLSAGLLQAEASPKAFRDPLRFSLVPIGVHTNPPPYNTSAAEIVVHDSGLQRLYVVNAQGRRLDVLDVQDPTQPTKLGQVELGTFGPVVNSVAFHDGLIAVAIEAAVKTDPGQVVLLDRSFQLINSIQVGALPDMLTFSPNGRWLLVANEGEPNTYNNFGSSTNGPSIDPEGSISVIDLSGGPAAATVRTATFAAFNHRPLPAGLRIYGPGASVAQDLEPEYITVSEDSTFAWITLQENNGIAVLHIPSAQVLRVEGLGFKDHSLPGMGLDASDQDGGIQIRPWPIRGIYNPDAIAHYRHRGQAYLVMANEGDTREYPGFREDVRLSTRTLDPAAFPNGDELKMTNALGRLAVSSVDGDGDGDGDLDAIFAYGGRSFSIRTAAGALVWDSGDQLEQLTAAVLPNIFNASHGNNTRDSRSTSKGPEPEGLALGRVAGRTLAFVGLERIGGVVVYNISDPRQPVLEDYINTRLVLSPFSFATAGDLGPEGLTFIPAEQSPNGRPLVVVAHEVSGSTVIFEVQVNLPQARGKGAPEP